MRGPKCFPNREILAQNGKIVMVYNIICCKTSETQWMPLMVDFWGHIQQCSVLLLALHSRIPPAGQGSNAGQPHGKEMPYPLYFNYGPAIFCFCFRATPGMAACKANTLPAMLLLQSLALLLLKSFSSIYGKLCYPFSLYEKWIAYYLICYAANIFVVIRFGMWLVHLFLTFFQIKLY